MIFVFLPCLLFLIWTQGKIGPGNRANPVNRALVKKLLDG